MIELLFYIIIATTCAIVSRILSGVDNGTFYAKGLWKETGGTQDHPNPKELKKYILPYYVNFHRIETPIWYTTYGMVFFFVMAFLRGQDTNFFISILSSVLISMGASAAGNLHYQGHINVGSGLPFVDPNEKSDSEFAVKGFSYWWKRPFSGNNRRISAILGLVAIGLGIAIAFY